MEEQLGYPEKGMDMLEQNLLWNQSLCLPLKTSSKLLHIKTRRHTMLMVCFSTWQE